MKLTSQPPSVLSNPLATQDIKFEGQRLRRALGASTLGLMGIGLFPGLASAQTTSTPTSPTTTVFSEAGDSLTTSQTTPEGPEVSETPTPEVTEEAPPEVTEEAPTELPPSEAVPAAETPVTTEPAIPEAPVADSAEEVAPEATEEAADAASTTAAPEETPAVPAVLVTSKNVNGVNVTVEPTGNWAPQNTSLYAPPGGSVLEMSIQTPEFQNAANIQVALYKLDDSCQEQETGNSYPQTQIWKGSLASLINGMAFDKPEYGGILFIDFSGLTQDGAKYQVAILQPGASAPSRLTNSGDLAVDTSAEILVGETANCDTPPPVVEEPETPVMENPAPEVTTNNTGGIQVTRKVIGDYVIPNTSVVDDTRDWQEVGRTPETPSQPIYGGSVMTLNISGTDLANAANTPVALYKLDDRCQEKTQFLMYPQELVWQGTLKDLIGEITFEHPDKGGIVFVDISALTKLGERYQFDVAQPGVSFPTKLTYDNLFPVTASAHMQAGSVPDCPPPPPPVPVCTVGGGSLESKNINGMEVVLRPGGETNNPPDTWFFGHGDKVGKTVDGQDIFKGSKFELVLDSEQIENACDYTFAVYTLDNPTQPGLYPQTQRLEITLQQLLDRLNIENPKVGDVLDIDVAKLLNVPADGLARVQVDLYKASPDQVPSTLTDAEHLEGVWVRAVHLQIGEPKPPVPVCAADTDGTQNTINVNGIRLSNKPGGSSWDITNTYFYGLGEITGHTPETPSQKIFNGSTFEFVIDDAQLKDACNYTFAVYKKDAPNQMFDQTLVQAISLEDLLRQLKLESGEDFKPGVTLIGDIAELMGNPDCLTGWQIDLVRIPVDELKAKYQKLTPDNHFGDVPGLRSLHLQNGATCQPPTTAPPITAPPTTAPPITAPPTTAPPTTAPPTTAPPTTAPPTTAPPTTVAPTPTGEIAYTGSESVLMALFASLIINAGAFLVWLRGRLGLKSS